jgi:hypothetical protein
VEGIERPTHYRQEDDVSLGDFRCIIAHGREPSLRGMRINDKSRKRANSVVRLVPPQTDEWPAQFF